MADSAGNLLESYTYDLYGTPTVYRPNGNIRANGSAYNIEHLFTGQRWIAEAGLYDYRTRFMHPELGRFLQPDVIGFAGGNHLYRYVGNNPANANDPMGLWTFQIGGSLTFQGGPFAVNFNFGIVIDGHGNFGTYNTVFGGGGAGAKVAGGVSIAGSNADQITELRKWFYNVSAGGYGGGGASADAFSGRTEKGKLVVGGGGTFGVGLGGGGYGGRSYTVVTPIWSPSSSTPAPPPGGTTEIDRSICPTCAEEERVTVTAEEPTDPDSTSSSVIVDGTPTDSGGRGGGHPVPPGYSYHPLTGKSAWGPPGISDIAARFENAVTVTGLLAGEVLSQLGGAPSIPGNVTQL